MDSLTVANKSTRKPEPETVDLTPPAPAVAAESADSDSPTQTPFSADHLAGPLPGEAEFDAEFTAADFEAEAEIYAGAGAAPEFIPLDVFKVTLAALIGAPNVVLQFKGIAPLQALAVGDDTPAFPEAAEALYRICCEVHWLQWMVRPETEWGQRAMVVGAFALGLYNAAAAEIAERKAAARAERAAGDKPSRSSAAAGARPNGDRADLTGVMTLDSTAVAA